MSLRKIESDFVDPRDSATSATLLRQVGLPAATALVVGGTIGVGIFLTPAGMARSLASPALLISVWTFIGGTALCGALCFGELAARFPEAGGGYVYLRKAFGPGVAFLYGWKCLLVMDPGITAALATGLGAYVQAMQPGVPPKLVAMTAILIVAIANIAGVRLAAGIGHFLAITKVGLLVLLVVWGFLSGVGSVSHIFPLVDRRPSASPLFPAMAGAVISAFFSFGGWWELTKLAGEVKEPHRNLPRALALGVITVTLLYVSVSAVFLYLVPIEAVASSEAFASQVGSSLFGNTGGLVLSAIVSLSILGSLFAFMTMAPRVYYAMAQDGVLPAFVARINPYTGAPVRAIAVQACLALFLVGVGTFDRIVAYFVFITVAFFCLKEKWGRLFPSAVQIIERDLDALLTFFQFDATYWTALRMTNPIERLNKEFKRRTKAMEVTGGETSTYRCLCYVAQTMEYRWSFHPLSQWSAVHTQIAA